MHQDGGIINYVACHVLKRVSMYLYFLLVLGSVSTLGQHKYSVCLTAINESDFKCLAAVHRQKANQHINQTWSQTDRQNIPLLGDEALGLFTYISNVIHC